MELRTKDIDIENYNYNGPLWEKTSGTARFGYNSKKSERWVRATRLKHLNLPRLLASKAGRSWSDIYSELCHKYTAVEDRRELDRLIDRYIVFKATCNEQKTKFFDTKGNGLKGWWEFAVVDNILYQVPRGFAGKKERRQSLRDWRAQRGIYVHNNEIYATINGVWYKLLMKPLEILRSRWGEPRGYPLDIFLGSSTKNNSYIYRLYGDYVYCYDKKQLNKNEIKKLETQLNRIG